MLVLSRHRDEQIVIGDDIVITVVELRGDKVRLGIDAPTEITVHRREVYEAIQREKWTGCHFPKSRDKRAELHQQRRNHFKRTEGPSC